MFGVDLLLLDLGVAGKTELHFVVSIRPIWVRNPLTPTFSCTRDGVVVPARGHGQSRWSSWSIMVRWSGLAKALPLRPVAILETDGDWPSK